MLQDLVREIAAGAALQACNHTIFKLEDVAMGSWIEYIGQQNKWSVNYDADTAFNFHGCQNEDIVSHYIKPEFARCMFANKDVRCCSRAEASRGYDRLEAGAGKVDKLGAALGRKGVQDQAFFNS